MPKGVIRDCSERILTPYIRSPWVREGARMPKGVIRDCSERILTPYILFPWGLEGGPGALRAPECQRE